MDIECSERAEKPVNEVWDVGSQLLHDTDYRIHGSYTATTCGLNRSQRERELRSNGLSTGHRGGGGRPNNAPSSR